MWEKVIGVSKRNMLLKLWYMVQTIYVGSSFNLVSRRGNAEHEVIGKLLFNLLCRLIPPIPAKQWKMRMDSAIY